jgi:hypothetical protein
MTTKPRTPRQKGGFINNTIRTIGEGLGGAIKGAVKGADDYVVGKTPGGQRTVDMPPVSLFTGLAGAVRGAYLGAQGKYAAPKGSADYQAPRSLEGRAAALAPTDKATSPYRVTGSGPSMGQRKPPNYEKPKGIPRQGRGQPMPNKPGPGAYPVPMPKVMPENVFPNKPGAKPVPMPEKRFPEGARPVPMPKVTPDMNRYNK